MIQEHSSTHLNFKRPGHFVLASLDHRTPHCTHALDRNTSPHDVGPELLGRLLRWSCRTAALWGFLRCSLAVDCPKSGNLSGGFLLWTHGSRDAFLRSRRVYVCVFWTRWGRHEFSQPGQIQRRFSFLNGRFRCWTIGVAFEG